MNINQWKEKEMEAKFKTQGRKNLYKKILIEVAAQHPLRKVNSQERNMLRGWI